MIQLCANALSVTALKSSEHFTWLIDIGGLTLMKSEFKMFLDWFLIPSNAGTPFYLCMYFIYVVICVLLSILFI